MNENAELDRIIAFYDDNGYFNNPTEETAYKLHIENKSLRNELCQKCGQYREAHNGSCNGCKWSKEN